MPRFFLPKDQIPVISGLPRTVLVRGSDVHHIKDVLRLKVGDKLELLDGAGKIYLSKISEISNDKVVCEVLEYRTSNVERRTQVAIAQCLPKAKKMDLIIQKCTELGVHKIIPALAERSIAKGEKLARWQKIAKEAAEQSGRSTIPEIAPLTKFEDVLKLRPDYDLGLIPWELEKSHTLKNHFADNRITGYPDILILIGPEGGFSQKEIEQAKEAGFSSISLGPRILRTETAGLAVLAMIMYALE